MVVGDDLVKPEAWDGLRTKTSGVFSIPTTREDFVRVAEGRTDIAARARAIDAWLEEQGAQRVASYGVGGAQLELWLHRLRPRRQLVVTDYGEATLERLTKVFPEAEVHYHDLRRDEPLPADVHLFHRIDTELTNQEWQEVYTRFRSVSVLVVPTKVLDVRGLLVELSHRARMNRRHRSSAGLMRTHAAFEALWQETHSSSPLRTQLDLDAWALTPRSADRANHT